MNENKMLNLYGVHFSDKFGKDYIKGKKEMKNTYQLMQRIRNSKKEFKDIDFVIGLSNIKKSTAQTKYIYTKKRGRPKKIIYGTEVGWHIHMYAFSEKGMVATFCEEIRKRLKNKGYRTYKKFNNSIENAIDYIEKQCQNKWYSKNLSPEIKEIIKQKRL